MVDKPGTEHPNDSIHWTIGFPIPDWLDVDAVIRRKIFEISLKYALLHLDIERQKIEEVKVLFATTPQV